MKIVLAALECLERLVLFLGICMYVCTSREHESVCRCQDGHKRTADLSELAFWAFVSLLSSLLETNSGPLQDQQALIAAEPSVRAPHYYLMGIYYYTWTNVLLSQCN